MEVVPDSMQYLLEVLNQVESNLKRDPLFDTLPLLPPLVTGESLLLSIKTRFIIKVSKLHKYNEF
jgi:hypothetical protein